MQPYKRGGRFYNNKHDSILRRLKNFSWSFFYIRGHHFLSLLKKQRALANTCSLPHSCTSKTQTHSLELLPKAGPELVITWLGHSTFLIQVAGINIVTDPIFFGKFPILSRKIPMPILPAKLPPIDVVLVSHNHKDHLDIQSLQILSQHKPLFLVPAGNGRWLKRRGYKRVVEKTWWESERIDLSVGDQSITITFLPAIHWTSRGLLDINTTLWGSWLIEASGRKIYFAGDTAYGDHFSMIAKRYGHIDVALMPIGPNEPRRYVLDSHINADEAVRAFIDLRARHFIPMHWGTFARMGAEQHSNPMSLLKLAWDKHSHDLDGAKLHIVACGEARNFGHLLC